MPRKLVKRLFRALPPEDSKGAFGMTEDNTEPLTEGSFAQHQAISLQPYHSGPETRLISTSLKGHTSQNHSSNSRPPKSSSPRHVQKSFAFFYAIAPRGSVKTFFTSMRTDYKRPLDPSRSLRLPNREFVSSLLVVPKKGGGHRPVRNLKPLNCFVPCEHFKTC